MNDRHYNPALAARLRTLVDGRQSASLTAWLGTLSHSQFRTAGYMLGEDFMPRLPVNDFWLLATELVAYHARAFLVTVLRSWVSRRPEVLLPFTLSSQPDDPSLLFFQSLRGRAEDVRKSFLFLLPHLTSPSGIEALQQVMGITDIPFRINSYLQALTPASAFLLVRALHEVEDDRALLIRITYHLIRQRGNLGFNIASLLRTLHGLDEVKGTFSLHLHPYQLSHLLSDYEAFRKVITM